MHVDEEFVRNVLGTFSFLFLFGLSGQVLRIWRRTGVFPVVGLWEGGFQGKMVAAGSLLLPGLLFAYAMAPAAFERMGRVPGMRAMAFKLGGLLALCLGTAVAAVAMQTMGSAWRIGVDWEERTQLISEGIYSRVRHPIYSGVLVACLGVFLMTASVFFLAVLLCYAAALWRQAVLEERYLEAQFGQEYYAYMKRTGRFFPKL